MNKEYVIKITLLFNIENYDEEFSNKNVQIKNVHLVMKVI